MIFKSIFINEALSKYMNGKSYIENDNIAISDLRLINITYWNFQNIECVGKMIVNFLVADEVLEIFMELYKQHFFIEQVVLIDNYEGDDNISMENNNTSCFNYRMVSGANRLSNHSFGLAIDINPVQNPYIKNGLVLPGKGIRYIDRENICKGMIYPNGICYNEFVSRGWNWGGDFEGRKDYHHFEKFIKGVNLY